MDSELQRRWVAASFAIGKIGHDPFGGHPAYQIQSLGRLDGRLRDEDKEIGELFDKNDEHEPSWALSDYLSVSRLWVLDGYELIRTLRGCLRAKLWQPPDAVTGDLARVEGLFKRVRIPLAKFEPAFRTVQAAPGDIVPEPVFVRGHGAGWNIGDSSPDIVARQELADSLLRSLEKARCC